MTESQRRGLRKWAASLFFVTLATLAGASAPASACVEKVPEGARRPALKETFPAHGTSGYVATLEVAVEHGKGESVLPGGIDLQADSELAKELSAAGFVIPVQDGGAPASLAAAGGAKEPADRVSSTLRLPLLLLPKEPGRHVLLLPPLPVAVARSSGEVMTLCTGRHSIRVEDPTAQTPEATPKANPAGLPQREEWTTLKWAVALGAVALALGALFAWLLHRWRRRPRPVPPPPPPRPPWEVALERLDEVRHAGLLPVGRFGEFVDRVSDTLRAYLGARYGFDGLESTTDEVLRGLAKAQPQGVTLAELTAFLQECDLVKFANVTPTPEDCARVLAAGEHVVRATMPQVRVRTSTAPAAGAGVAS